MHKRFSFFRWIPSVAWGLVIGILSLMPGGPGNMDMFGIPHFDKIGHFGMYAVWTFLIRSTLYSQSSGPGHKFVWGVVIFGALTGILLEVGQLMMHQGRSFEVADMVANALGAVAGVVVGSMPWVRRMLFRERKK